MPPHVNGMNRLFGGQLMAWIDTTAAVEARRHTGRQVITAVVDNLSFLGPAFLDETARLEARVTWTGKTSLEVRVDSFAEPLSGTKRLINRAYLVFVALDDEGKPVPVPPFEPQTAEEKEEWNRALERRKHRLLSRPAL
jgi:acyl-CoA hydrolase